MNRKLVILGVVLSSTVASIASAEGASASAGASTSGVAASGLQLGLRVGYALPMGTAQGSAAMSDGFSGGLPIILDVGYRFSPNIYAGVYGQYGLLFIKDQGGTCSNGISCSGSDIRVGINAHYHIMPAASFDPWVGLGVGYEIASQKYSGGAGGVTVDGSGSLKGLELVNVQVGGDYHVSPQVGIGPFVSFSLGQYSSASSKLTFTPANPILPNIDTSGDITDKAMHEWLTFGVRGVFNL